MGDGVLLPSSQAWGQGLPTAQRYVNNADIFLRASGSVRSKKGNDSVARQTSPKAGKPELLTTSRWNTTEAASISRSSSCCFRLSRLHFRSRRHPCGERLSGARTTVSFTSLTANRGMTVADLLDTLKITKQSLARVLKQLIDSGYIRQMAGPEDRRQRKLYPTRWGASWRLLWQSRNRAVLREHSTGASPRTRKA